jgi:hypothetical protein
VEGMRSVMKDWNAAINAALTPEGVETLVRDGILGVLGAAALPAHDCVGCLRASDPLCCLCMFPCVLFPCVVSFADSPRRLQAGHAASFCHATLVRECVCVHRCAHM